MLRLFILRHVFTNHALPGQRDFERTISDIGQNQLNTIGKTISDNAYQPDIIYCSPAMRTQQTFEGIENNFSKTPKVVMPEYLYSCITPDYFNTIIEHKTPENIMIIGHNPMCSGLALMLCKNGASQPFYHIKMGFSEGSLAVIDFDIDCWTKLKKKSGYLTNFHIPE